MKALSIRQPWAWLIVNGYKNIENRTWALPKTFTVPQRIYVHAGLRMDRLTRTDWYRLIEKMSRTAYAHLMDEGGFKKAVALGAIVGEVDIVGQGESDSRWAVPGQHHWHLGNGWRGWSEPPNAYETPIPYKGRLGFFEVELEAREAV